MESPQIRIDPAQCVGCGLCARVCVVHNLGLSHQKAKTRRETCLLCGQCTAVCPRNAITLDGRADEPVEKRGEVRLNPDELLDVIRFRRSVRRFKPDPIPPDVVGKILEAGRLTHTAKNLQDVSFVVLQKEKDRLEQMAVRLFKRLKPIADCFSPLAREQQIDDHFFFFHAPMAIVLLAKEKTNGILAAQNMEFEAEANGLGVLFSGFFTMAANRSPAIRKALSFPKGNGPR